MAQEELEIGVVLGVHGVRGAVLMRLFDAGSDALEQGRCLNLVRDGRVQREQVKIERVSQKPGTDKVRVWLEGLTDRDEAMALRGCRVTMAKAQLRTLDQDEFYLADLIGLSVRHLSAPKLCLGTVESVVDNRMQDLLQVCWEDAGKTTRWLLPAVGPYIEDIRGDELWICAPVGLLPEKLAQLVEGASS